MPDPIIDPNLELDIDVKIDFDGSKYDSNDAGDLLNEDGTIFKTKAEVDEFNDADPPEVTQVDVDGVMYDLDAEGNALKDGEIFKTKEDLEALSTPPETDEEIQIDDVTYTIDKYGNAVDKEGIVFKTKEELEALSTIDDDEVNFNINKIAESTGLTLLDETGNAVDYENSEVGAAAYVKDVYAEGISKGIDDGIKSLYAINPLIESFVQHVKLNGSAEGFNQNVAYSTMTVDEKNEDAMIALIRAEGKAKGDTEARISQTVSWAKSDNKLGEFSKESLKYLQAQESVESKNRSTALAQQEANKAAAHKATVDSIANIMNTGKISLGEDKEFIIPKTLELPTQDGKKTKIDSMNLVDYITNPREYTVDGKVVQLTPYEAKKLNDERTMTTEQTILHAIQMLTGTKMEDIISRSVSSATVKKIRKFSTKKGKGEPITPPTLSKSTYNKKNIDFDA